jgi:hypothetical protein
MQLVQGVIPMKLWLDDIREMPNEYDFWATTAADAIVLLKTGEVTDVSLDHDLGLPEEELGTGYQVACWIEEAAFKGEIPKLEWRVHSQNNVGVDKMTQALRAADHFWEVKPWEK